MIRRKESPLHTIRSGLWRLVSVVPLPGVCIRFGEQWLHCLKRFGARAEDTDPVHLPVNRVRHDPIEGGEVVFCCRTEKRLEGRFGNTDVEAKHTRATQIRELIILVVDHERREGKHSLGAVEEEHAPYSCNDLNSLERLGDELSDRSFVHVSSRLN